MATSNPNLYPIDQQVYSLAQITNAAFGMSFSQPSDPSDPSAFDQMSSYVNSVIVQTLSVDQGSTGGNYLGSTPSGGTASWQQVWGPVVYCAEPNNEAVVADNIMALFYNTVSNVYLVTIAGTNADSSFDWLSEDLKVSNKSEWKTLNTPDGTKSISKAPSEDQVDNGSLNGMKILINMKDSNGNSIFDALNTALNTTPSSTLYVSGHSLGAALGGLMGLYLYENNKYWNPSGNTITINTLISASPTTGNGDFTKYYTDCINKTLDGVSLTYNNYCNTIDVVPMNWALSTMINIPFVYDAPIANASALNTGYTCLGTPNDAIAGAIVTGAIMSSFHIGSSDFDKMINNQYAQIQPQTTFAGTYVSGNLYDQPNNPVANNSVLSALYLGLNEGISHAFNDIFDSTLKDSKLNGYGGGTNYTDYLIDFGNFVLQLIYQHTVGYYGVSGSTTVGLGIYDFMNEFQFTIMPTVPQPLHPAKSSADIKEKMARRILSKHLPTNCMDAIIAAGQQATTNA